MPGGPSRNESARFWGAVGLLVPSWRPWIPLPRLNNKAESMSLAGGLTQAKCGAGCWGWSCSCSQTRVARPAFGVAHRWSWPTAISRRIRQYLLTTGMRSVPVGSWTGWGRTTCSAVRRGHKGVYSDGQLQQPRKLGTRSAGFSMVFLSSDATGNLLAPWSMVG